MVGRRGGLGGRGGGEIGFGRGEAVLTRTGEVLLWDCQYFGFHLELIAKRVREKSL